MEDTFNNLVPATVIPTDQLLLDESSPLPNRFGNLHKGTWNNRVVAIRVLSPELPRDLFLACIECWESLTHPNVMQIFGASHPDPPEGGSLYFVAPFFKNGNVRDYLKNFPNADRQKLILQTAHGMRYLHERSITHGSLRPSNILINDDGQACIADCGISETSKSGSADTYQFLSPEACAGESISDPSDVYAFAMCAYEIFTSTLPWGDRSEKYVHQLVVYEDGRPEHPDAEKAIRVGLSSQLWSIIEESWHKEPRLRPTFAIIIRLWEAAVADNTMDISAAATRIVSRSLYPSNPIQDPTMSSSSLSSGPPAYEAEEIVSPAPLSSLPSTSSTATTKPPDFRRTMQPPRAIKVPSVQITSDQVPHSAPLFPTSPEFRDTPTIHSSTPRRNTSLPSTPFTPPFHATLPVVDEHGHDVEALHYKRITTPARTPNRTPPPPVGGRLPSRRFTEDRSFIYHSSPPSISPSVSSSGSSAGHANPLTPPSTSSPLPAVAVSSSYPGAIQRRATKISLVPKHTAQTDPEETSLFSEDIYAALPPITPRQVSLSRHDSVMRWEANQRRFNPIPESVLLPPDVQSIKTDSNSGGEPSVYGAKPNPVLLVGALQAEVGGARSRTAIDEYLVKIHILASDSHKDAQKLITAGAITTLIHLLKTRAADLDGLEIVLMALGTLSHDSLSANTIHRTNTTRTLIDIFDSSTSPEVMTLVCWCLNRICRNVEIAGDLIKQNLVRLLVKKGLSSDHATPSISAYCLGTLAQSDGLAESLADLGVVDAIADFLRASSESPESRLDDICSALYAIARISRSIKLAKTIAKAGCVPLLAHHLARSEDPQVLNWSARAVGCLMRPNSSDMSKILLDAGIAAGLARLPSVLPTEEVEPLSSFAFAIQRFSAAEWGSGTRKSLVQAGVVDSLLAALRTAAEEPCPQVHIDLALAVSFLSDIGGAPIRKEIVNAGGIDILRKVGAAAGNPEVSKACNMAVKSTTGNIWSRNAASAKTAMAHTWNGGCPECQPSCPLVLTLEENAFDPPY